MLDDDIAGKTPEPEPFGPAPQQTNGHQDEAQYNQNS
jgi:hypothetical protein